VSIDFTIPNQGLYTLNVTLTCDNSNPNVVCQTGHVSVQPGQEQVLQFKLTVANVQEYYSSSDHRINGTLTMAMGPFVSLTIGTDLSSLVPQEGA
jgi:hypothetical protein